MGLFNDVIGHDRQKDLLLKAHRRRRLASSYLFSGEEGIGKKRFAIEFIKFLYCIDRGGDNGTDSCGLCRVCRNLQNLNHPDLLLIEPEGTISIEKVREAQDFLKMRPLEAPLKTLVVDDAETMTLQAANAFLKTLEEPPPHSLIILISSRPFMLPSTVRSRCLNISFQLLSQEQTEEVLKRVFPELTESERISLSRLVMGRPGLAMKMKPHLEVTEGLLKGDGISSGRLNREEISEMIEILRTILRDLLVYRCTGEERLLLNLNNKRLVRRGSNTITTTDIIDVYNNLSFIKENLHYNPNTALVQNVIEVEIRRLLK